MSRSATPRNSFSRCFVLRTGNTAVVKATITGAIIGNSLLGLGMSILVGSADATSRPSSAIRAGLLASLLILSVIALLLPALFDYSERSLVSPAREHLLDGATQSRRVDRAHPRLRREPVLHARDAS